MLKELIKAQTEAAKRAEEEKKELFQYLRKSDNYNTNTIQRLYLNTIIVKATTRLWGRA